MVTVSQVFAIISLLFGIGGFLTAREAVREREPIFILDPIRISILKKENIQNAPIKVTKNDGSEVTSDLTAVRFYFWNKGKKSIRRKDILKKICITLGDSVGEILKCDTLKTHNIDITELQFIRDKKTIIIDFAILGYNDGVAAQIIYEGSRKSNFYISGVIDEVDKIKESEDLTNIVTTIMLTFFLIITIVLNKILHPVQKTTIKNNWYTIIIYHTSLAATIAISIYLVFRLIPIIEYPIKYVPKSILPENIPYFAQYTLISILIIIGILVSLSHLPESIKSLNKKNTEI